MMAGTFERSIPTDEKEESKLKEFFRFIDEYFELDKKLQNAKTYAEDHPIGSLFFLIITAMCTGPIICFVIFVGGSVTVTFCGFLFVEGTFLIIAIMVLGGVLVFVCLLAVGICIFLLALAYIVKISGDLYQKSTEAIQSYLPSVNSSKQGMVAKAE
ncbi:hypothetical protein ACJMK2_034221 [Sinanodonta woodiana]|uniref:Promethin n=1 Tax=Sinanodonta woodiana TaxID=1069815 RepID=A0ABD3WUB7_SINWO